MAEKFCLTGVKPLVDFLLLLFLLYFYPDIEIGMNSPLSFRGVNEALE